MARSKDPREKTRYTGATLATQVVTTLAALLFLAPCSSFSTTRSRQSASFTSATPSPCRKA